MEVNYIRVGSANDKRRKLSPETISSLRTDYRQGMNPTNIAKKYNISRTYVYYILDEKLRKRQNEKAIKYIKTRGVNKTDKHRKTCSKHNDYKRQLYKEGNAITTK